jgi:hypothetical protein
MTQPPAAYSISVFAVITPSTRSGIARQRFDPSAVFTSREA